MKTKEKILKDIEELETEDWAFESYPESTKKRYYELKATLKGYELCEKEKDEEYSQIDKLCKDLTFGGCDEWIKYKGMLFINQEEFKKFIEELKEELNKIVWDIAVEEGGSNLHYNDLISEKIDKLASKYNHSPQSKDSSKLKNKRKIFAPQTADTKIQEDGE